MNKENAQQLESHFFRDCRIQENLEKVLKTENFSEIKKIEITAKINQLDRETNEMAELLFPCETWIKHKKAEDSKDAADEFWFLFDELLELYNEESVDYTKVNEVLLVLREQRKTLEIIKKNTPYYLEGCDTNFLTPTYQEFLEAQ
ncbi:hypothetical protein HWV00_18680 [Moritella sp. 24]|uniref:hypothetical protein n=1 Tax=Moritella sp. 24 TaxID=2746230 RepID=UPI001BA621EF|nr:hypothetical protein [Moritella sp. 24]QUM78073.1 hypothetical protein HWV00_18680 [Moritella sp. 24]